jgi:hypothetical protein
MAQRWHSLPTTFAIIYCCAFTLRVLRHSSVGRLCAQAGADHAPILKEEREWVEGAKGMHSKLVLRHVRQIQDMASNINQEFTC